MRGRISVHEADAGEATREVEARTDATVRPVTSTSGRAAPAAEDREAPDGPVVTDADVEEQFTESEPLRSRRGVTPSEPT